MVDPRGNEQGATPADHTWEYEYDNEDRQTYVIAPAPTSGGNELVTQYQYDDVGNKVVMIDPNGQVTKYSYDVRDSLYEVRQSPLTWTDPANPPATVYVTRYLYDDLGNLKRVIRAQGNGTYERATDYVYDGLGRVRKEIQYPNWTSTTTKLTTEYTYDKNGNQVTLKSPLLKTTTYGYDALNRLTSITYNDASTPNVTYTYDANGNRTSMVDGTGTTSYTYDEWNMILSISSPGSVTVGYRYDRHSNRTKLIYPDSTEVDYSFDEADRLTTVVDWANRTTTYEYLADSRVMQLNHDNGSSADYTYDNAGRLTQVWNMYGDETITRHAYTLDPVGNRTHSDEVLTVLNDYPGEITQDRQGTIDYEYDAMYRLTSEDRDLPSPQYEDIWEYTYDPVGNRLSQTYYPYPANPLINYPTDFSHDRADRILEADGYNDEEFTVNANGNITYRGSSGDDPLVYDQENRLIRTDEGASTKRYTYDGDGKRTKIREGLYTFTTIETYVYDVNRSLPVLIEDLENKYVWGLGILYVVNSDDDPGFYHLDGLGSVQAITEYPNYLGLGISEYETYYAFGEKGYSNRDFGEPPQPMKFTGEQDDEDVTGTNYVYLRERYYDPTLGRFLTRDPYGGDTTSPLSLNRYTYVENNPVNLIDPSGLWLVDINVSGGFVVGVTAGVQVNLEGIHPYVGGGLTTPGIGVGVLYSKSDPTPGWNVSGQLQFLATGQYGYSFGESGESSVAIGLTYPAKPGASIMGSYVFPSSKPKEVKPAPKK